MEADTRKVIGVFSAIFGREGDPKRVLPGFSFPEEVLVALEDFRFGECFKEEKGDLKSIAVVRHTYDKEKKNALDLIRGSKWIGPMVGPEKDPEKRKKQKEYLVHLCFLAALIHDRRWEEVWKKFLRNSRSEAIVYIYLNRLPLELE